MQQIDQVCNAFALRLRDRLFEYDIQPAAISSIDYMRYRVESAERYEYVCRELGGFATRVEDRAAEAALGADIFKYDMQLSVGNWPLLHLLVLKPGSDTDDSDALTDRVESAGLLIHGHLVDFKRQHRDLPIAGASHTSPEPFRVDFGDEVRVDIDDTPLAAKLRLGLLAVQKSGVPIQAKSLVL